MTTTYGTQSRTVVNESVAMEAAILRSPSHRLTALRELCLLGGLYLAYSLSRVLAANDLPAARERARSLVDVERTFHIDVESWLNHATADIGWLALPMDYWYSVLHYVVTPAVLVWLYLRHRTGYPRARNALVITSGLGLIGYLISPTAPPRLMEGSSYTDTLALYAHAGWWNDHASAPAGLGGLTNELAAMPSLHVGWAVWVAWVLFSRVRGFPRLLAVLYPLATAVVVVGTGNHWVVDCAVGVAVTAAGIAASTLPAARARRSPRIRAGSIRRRSGP
jgi:hypothetical protein